MGPEPRLDLILGQPEACPVLNTLSEGCSSPVPRSQREAQSDCFTKAGGDIMSSVGRHVSPLCSWHLPSHSLPVSQA